MERESLSAFHIAGVKGMADREEQTPAGESPCIRVAVVDDHALVRSGICDALRMSGEVQVVAEASDGIGALEILERQQIDVLLLDLRMPRMDGYECLDRIRQQWPALPVVVLTVDEDPETSLRVMDSGAAAYVPKYIHPADLVSVVRQVAAGSILIVGSRGTARNVSEVKTKAKVEAFGLTERELQVLQLVAQGKTNSEIAEELYVTTKTVKFHLTSIFVKMRVSNRTEAATSALTNGLVRVEGPRGGK